MGKGNIWQKAANTVQVAATVDDIMVTFDFNIMTARSGLCGTRSDKPKIQHRNHHHRHQSGVSIVLRQRHCLLIRHLRVYARAMLRFVCA